MRVTTLGTVITTTSNRDISSKNIIHARGNGVIRANVKSALTSLPPNKLVDVVTIPFPKNSVVSVIGNSTAPIVTITIFNEEAITKHDPSVT